MSDNTAGGGGPGFGGVTGDDPDIWYWGGNVDQYLKLLYTAYKAVQDGNATSTRTPGPPIKVLDCGFPSVPLGYCIGRMYYLYGTQVPGPYATLALDYFSNYKQSRGYYPYGETDPVVFATDYFHDISTPNVRPEIQNTCDNFMATAFPNYGNRVDYVNFH